MIGATKRSPQPFPGQRPIAEFNKMKFLAIESLRISLELNISAAREQQAWRLGVGFGPFFMRYINLTLGLLPPRRHVAWRDSVGVESWT